MPTRIVEGKLPYTGGDAISIDENKVISLNLRDENNLIIYDAQDDEIYVDLQLPDGIKPTDAFPVGVTTGRVLVADGWDKAGTIISAKTTSGDVIKLLYADDGTLWIDNGTGTFKQIYFKADVDLIIQTLTAYINAELAKKQNGVVSATAPESPAQGDLWYDTTNDEMKVYDGTQWTGLGGSDIVYATQAEYEALLPGAASDGKHYFIYSTSGGGGWQPGADTILYYDFEHTSGTTESNLATTGNTYDGIYSATPSIGTLASGKKYFDTQGNIYSATSSGFSTMNYNNGTVCIWLNPQEDTQARSFFGQSWWGTPGGGTSSGLGTIFCEKLSNGDYAVELGQPYSKTISGSNIPAGSWTCYTITDYNGTVTVYCNGIQVQQGTNEYLGNPNSTKFCVGGAYEYGNASPRNVGDVWYGSVIVENKVRTAQEVADYYDQTKGDYGIS